MTPRRPQMLTLLPRSRGQWPLLLLGMVVPLTLLAFLAQHFAFGGNLAFESGLAGLLRSGRTAEKDALARALDAIGSGWFVLPLSAILAGIPYRVRRRLGWFVFWVVAGAALLHLNKKHNKKKKNKMKKNN